MHLAHLYLKYFRNFSEQQFEFGKNFNIFVGKNAQGKTNILEAVHLLATGKSFRTSEFRDMISWQQAAAKIKAQNFLPAGSDDWNATLCQAKKTIQKNGKQLSSRTKRGLAAVLFAPEEILLLRDSPAERRRYVDALIVRFSPQFGTIVRQYARVLSQRNRILTDDELAQNAKRAQLEPWNSQLIELGTKITKARHVWSAKLNEELAKQYAAIARRDEPAEFVYEPFYQREQNARPNGDFSNPTKEHDIQAVFQEQLVKRLPDELIRRRSLVGPHRDDFNAALGRNSIKHFGSQGQHRTFVLALKIAEVELFRLIEGHPPIFLLDDVASELDEERNHYFFSYLEKTNGQVFVSTTEKKLVHLYSEGEIKAFSVENGTAKAVPWS